MKDIKLYNTYKFSFDVYGKSKEIIGAPYLIEKSPLEVRVAKLDGTTVTLRQVDSVNSIRLSSEVRSAMKNYAMSCANLYLLQKEYETKLSIAKKRKSEYEEVLKKATGILPACEFVGKLDIEIYKKTGINFDCSSWYFSDDNRGSYVEIARTIDICKWATPEEYPFIHRRYDGTLYLDDDNPDVARYAEKYAATVLPILKKISLKTEKRLALGDKGTLYAETIYRLPIKYGCTQKSIDEIVSAI